MNNGVVEEKHAMFKNPDACMMNHLKPLFICEKVDKVGVNKVFVDGGTIINLMPRSLLKRKGKYDSDLHPHNKMLSNYEGKTSHILYVI